MRYLAILLLLVMSIGCAKKTVQKETPPPEPKTEVIAEPPSGEPVEDVSPAPDETRDTLFRTTIYFDFNDPNVRLVSYHKLKVAGDILSSFPDKQIIIGGHCDSRGSHRYNMALGDARAMSVAQYLKNLGVLQSQMMPISYGEEIHAKECGDDPYPINDDCHRWNRRVEIVMPK